MANHKQLIDVAASLDRNWLFCQKGKGILKIDQSVKCRDIGLGWELHGPTQRLLWALIVLSATIVSSINYHYFVLIVRFEYCSGDRYGHRQRLVTVTHCHHMPCYEKTEASVG